MSNSQDEKYLTRAALVQLVNEKLGIPLKKSTVDKDTHYGRGPKPVAKYGPKDLYTLEESLRYGRSKISKCSPEGEANAA